jgi:hypothetical protein
MLRNTSVKISCAFRAIGFLLAAIVLSLSGQSAAAASDKCQRATPTMHHTHHLYAPYRRAYFAHPQALPYGPEYSAALGSFPADCRSDQYALRQSSRRSNGYLNHTGSRLAPSFNVKVMLLSRTGAKVHKGSSSRACLRESNSGDSSISGNLGTWRA